MEDNGNLLLQTGGYTRTDGTGGQTADIWFLTDNRNNTPKWPISGPIITTLPAADKTRQQLLPLFL